MIPEQPHSDAAEQSLIGGCVLSNDAYWDLPPITPGDFWRAEHAVMWAALCDLAATDRPFDMVTLAETLERSGKLEAAGGLNYLGIVINETSSAANVKHYADIVRAKAELRRLAAACLSGHDQALDPSADSKTLADEIEALVFAARSQDVTRSEPRLISDLVAGVMAEIDNRSVRPAGTPIGLRDLDASLMGLRPGQLVVVGARPSVGKSALALTVALHVAQQAGPVAFFALEMTADEMTERALAQLSRVSVSRIRAGRLGAEHWADITQASKALRGLPLILADQPAIRPSDLRSACRRLKRQHGSLALVVVDHIGLMRSDLAGHQNRTADLTQISGALKNLAKELACPVLALSQLNRDVERRGSKPMLSDLRDSGSIEQDADMVVLLHRDLNEAPTFADAKVAKNRNGPVGTVRLGFIPELALFEDAA